MEIRSQPQKWTWNDQTRHWKQNVRINVRQPVDELKIFISKNISKETTMIWRDSWSAILEHNKYYSQTIMADQPPSVNPAPHSRGGRHRSRKQQKPSTAEREQKKASRLQALGPGESIKEKQVSDDCKRAKTFMTSWSLACHATRSWGPWCCRNVLFLLVYVENPMAVS